MSVMERTVADRNYGDGTYGSGYYGVTTLDPRALPVVEVQLPDGSWLDVTCDVRTIDIERGRSSWVGAFAAGTASIALANPRGIYSAWTPDSVWRQANGSHTDVPIRVSVDRLAARGPLFTGTTDAVIDTWPGTIDSLAAVTASDGFKRLARHNGGPRAAVGAGELTGARIARLADDAGWTDLRRIDAGKVPLQAGTLDGVTLDLMRTVGESEWGWLYIGRDGALVFRQRDAIDTDPRMTTVQWTFTDTDALAGACYGDLVLKADSDAIVNVATVTPPGVPAQSFTNATSVGWFGPRTWSRTDLPIQNAGDAQGLAQLVVLAEAFDDRRVDAVVFDAANRANSWPAAQGVRLTDRIRVLRTFPGGWQLDAELIVQGRKDSIVAGGMDGGPSQWTVTLATASAASIADLGLWDVGTWDDSTWGT